jgi:hypothetical protein
MVVVVGAVEARFVEISSGQASRDGLIFPPTLISAAAITAISFGVGMVEMDVCTAGTKTPDVQHCSCTLDRTRN